MEKKGTSYFDRLWRTGAGKHADVKKRYIVTVCTSGGERGSFNGNGAAHSSTKTRNKSVHGRKRTENNFSSGKQKDKKPKKRSAEAQKRRNERRLLKKEQAQQAEKSEA
eukprot:scaffold15349_cov139-Skeletonema_dohrnii-CCMP3373.AAC.1